MFNLIFEGFTLLTWWQQILVVIFFLIQMYILACVVFSPITSRLDKLIKALKERDEATMIYSSDYDPKIRGIIQIKKEK